MEDHKEILGLWIVQTETSCLPQRCYQTQES